MIAGVVLAAGAGRRFGGAKQLALVDGEPLVRRACRIALAVGLDPVLVVLGAHAAPVAAAVADLAVRPVVNPRAAEGMGSSVACAVRRLADDPAITALAILLADQPDIPAVHLRALCEAAAAAPVAATRHGTAVGAPAVFERSMFGALAALTGDRGARDLIAACPDRVELALEAAARDIDSPSDLRSRRA
jgi:CTP:molybdopterin cytidylyltransferase MocA